MRAKVPVELTCEQCHRPFEAVRRDARRCSATCRAAAAREATSAVAEPRTGGHEAVRSARALIAALGDLDEADAVLATALVQISEMVDRRPSAALFRELRGLVDALAGRAA